MENYSILFSIIIIAALGVALGCALIGISLNHRFTPKPPEHLRPKTKCICNNIGKHSPGGRCEACFEKNTMPRYENPPAVPKRKEYVKSKI